MSDSDQPDGFLATPPTGSGPAVLLLHAWWGLNETMRSTATRLADEGFVVFAPDLYHGTVADTINGAEAAMRAMDATRAKADIAAAVDFLRERAGDEGEGIAVVAFSLGASYAMDLAAEPEPVRAAVIFYGAIPGEYGASRAAFLGHFAANDDFEPLEVVEEMEDSLREAGRPATFHIYPGTGHWFFEPDREDAYDAEAASLAWERTVAFLKEQMAA